MIYLTKVILPNYIVIKKKKTVVKTVFFFFILNNFRPPQVLITNCNMLQLYIEFMYRSFKIDTSI